jgi:ESF2/ABP1 family protein
MYAADPAAQKRRIAAGGNKKPMFVEGWVEFVDKKDAKFAVATLNTQPMGASSLNNGTCRPTGLR